jgi:hypothetical protein
MYNSLILYCLILFQNLKTRKAATWWLLNLYLHFPFRVTTNGFYRMWVLAQKRIAYKRSLKILKLYTGFVRRYIWILPNCRQILKKYYFKAELRGIVSFKLYVHLPFSVISRDNKTSKWYFTSKYVDIFLIKKTKEIYIPTYLLGK